MAEIDRLLAAARAGIEPRATVDDLVDADLVIDIRPVDLRSRDGALTGAVIVDRNVLEWRLDPTSEFRLPEVTSTDLRIVLVCDEGYASSLAAAGLRALGLSNVTDLDGGYHAWRQQRRAGGRRSPGAASTH